jgi:dGTPase
MTEYDNIFSTARLKQSTIDRKKPIDNFYSDRSRIIYCSSFRRLQQKAQVFSLEPNCNVRTRLTHSIEVSDLGRSLANKIGYALYDKEFISTETIPIIVAIVENACLLHDIGNPPFGHFGEAAIKKWAKESLSNLIKQKCSKRIDAIDITSIQNLNADFREFDGNPQGFRIISKLHNERDEYSLNLTVSTLLSGLKYVRAAGEDASKTNTSITKKAGYFQSEQDTVETLWKMVGKKPHTRFPLTYIMEAADDIAYCLSDISDGLEKNIIQPNSFLTELRNTWDKNHSSSVLAH